MDDLRRRPYKRALLKTDAVEDDADSTDNAGMTASPFSCSSIVLPILVASALFIGAIMAGNFWLSVVLGCAGAISLAYAVSVLREARKTMTEEKKGKP